MARSRIQEIGVGCLLVTAFALLGVMALKVGALDQFGNPLRVELRMVDAAGIGPGAEVAVAGVQVGTVGEMRIDHDHAIAELLLGRDIDLRKDVEVKIRARSVLGEKYVELRPMSRDTARLEDGDRLSIDIDQMEIDEMVNAMGPVLTALEPERLGKLIRRIDDALAEDPERIGRFVEHLDAILKNGAAASEDLPEMVSDGHRAVRAAERALERLEATVVRADEVLGEAQALVEEVRSATAPLPEVVQRANSILGEASEMSASLDGIDEELRVVIGNLAEIDKWELRRLLREEGILVRVRPQEVEEDL